METPKKASVGRRKIHVDLPEHIHRMLRVKAALEDMSMQAFVARVVEKAVKDVLVPAGGNHHSGERGLNGGAAPYCNRSRKAR